jgi:hypothetical protein
VGEAQVVKHRADVEELPIEAQPAALPGERTEVVDAAGMVKEQVGLLAADQLGGLTSKLAIRDGHSFDVEGHGGLLSGVARA